MLSVQGSDVLADGLDVARTRDTVPTEAGNKPAWFRPTEGTAFEHESTVTRGHPVPPSNAKVDSSIKL